MQDKKKPKKAKKAPKFDYKKAGLNIDKAEYQEIVLSNSADPNKGFYSRRDY